MTAPLLLVAAGGLAREVLSVCRRVGIPVAGLIDDDPAKLGTSIGGFTVLAGLDAIGRYPDARLLVCAGRGQARRAIVGRLTASGVSEERFATVLDPSVHVPASCSVGAGTILLAGTVLTADVRVGRHVVCMPQVTLTHDDVLEDYATLAAGATLGGGVRVGEAAYLGMNASVREGLTIGDGAVLGMGAVLVRDQPAGSVLAGNPARPIVRE